MICADCHEDTTRFTLPTRRYGTTMHVCADRAACEERVRKRRLHIALTACVHQDNPPLVRVAHRHWLTGREA